VTQILAQRRFGENRKEVGGALLEEVFIVESKGVVEVALDVDQADDSEVLGENGNNDFRTGSSEGREPAWIFQNIADINDGFAYNGGTTESAGNGKTRERRRNRSATGDQADVRGGDFVEADPAVAACRGNPVGSAFGLGGPIDGLTSKNIPPSA